MLDAMLISGETDVTTVTDGRFTAVIDGMSISGKTDIIEGAVHHLRLSVADLIEQRAASCRRAP